MRQWRLCTHVAEILAQKGRGIFRVAWLSEQITLSTGTAELHKPCGLSLFLNALCNDLHAQSLAHGKNGTNDVLGRTVVKDG